MYLMTRISKIYNNKKLDYDILLGMKNAIYIPVQVVAHFTLAS